MNTKQYCRLTNDQKNQIHTYFLRPPTNLAAGVSSLEFPREFDVYVYAVNPRFEPVKTYDGKPITSGRFFRIVQFSNKVLAALYFDHDRDGIFGQPKTVLSFSLADFSLTKLEYGEILTDLSEAIHSVDSAIHIEWEGMEFVDTGPGVRTGPAGR